MKRLVFVSVAAMVITACTDVTQPSDELSQLDRALLNQSTPSTFGIENAATLFGPVVFTRGRGTPVTETRSVAGDDFDNFEGPFVLHLLNGTEDGRNRISSAHVVLDGVELFGPSDFSQQVSELTTDINLNEDSELSVTLASKPGSQITIEVLKGVKIEPGGGEVVIIEGQVTLDFPPGAIEGDIFITATPVPESELPDDPSIVPGTAFEFGPSGTTFLEPVTLCVQYEQGLLPVGTDESELRIHLLMDGSFTQLDAGSVDTENNIVCAEVDHFSVFVIVQRATPGGDVDPPVITNVTVNPSVVDITTASADVTVTIDATDDISGVEFMELQFWAPTAGPGGQVRSCFVADFNRVSGSPTSGTWECTITIPFKAETGMWKVGLAFVQDAAANQRFFSRDLVGDLCAQDGSGCITAWDPAIDVQGPPGDIAAPIIGSFSFETPSVDVSLGDADVTATVTMTDDLSGIEFLTMQLASPSGTQFRDCFFFNDGSFDPALNLTIDCTFTMQQFSEAGTWDVTGAILSDKVGNQRIYFLRNAAGQLCTEGEAECADLNAPLTVISPTDLLPPTITGFSLATDADPSRVIATITASDNLSGVATIEIQFTSPTAGQVQHCFGIETVTPGVWECEIQFPDNAEAGTWPLTLFLLRDFAGNQRFYFRDVNGDLCSNEIPVQACTDFGDTEIIVQ